jgi:hypothetical protein
MRIGRTTFLLVTAQIVGALLSLFFFRSVWPGQGFGMGRGLVTAATPVLIWIAPLLIYVAGELACPAARDRMRRTGWALVGIISIVIAYQLALHFLHQWEVAKFHAAAIDQCTRNGAEVCPSFYPMLDPPSPPLYWEWAGVASIAALIGLYAALYRWKSRAMRPVAEAPR